MANALQIGKTNSVLLFGDYGTEVIRLSQLYDPAKDKYHPVGEGVAAGTAIAPVLDGSVKYYTYTQRRRTLTFSEIPSSELAPGTRFVGTDGYFTTLGLKSIWQAYASEGEDELSSQVGHYVPVIKTLVVADTNDDKWGDNTLLLVVDVTDGTTENDKTYRALVDTATNSTNPSEKAAAQQQVNEYVPTYKSTLEPINFSAGIDNPTRAVDYSNDTFGCYVEDVVLKNIGNGPTQDVPTQKITLDRRLMMYGQARLRYVIKRENDRSSTVICTNSVTTERQDAPGFIDFIPVDAGTSVAGVTPDWFESCAMDGKTVVYFDTTGVRCTAQMVMPNVPSGSADTQEQRKREAIEACTLYQELLASFNAGNQIYVHDHPDSGLANLQMPDICYRRTGAQPLVTGEELTISVYEYFVDAGADYTRDLDDYRQVMNFHVTVKPATSLAQYDVSRKNIVGFEVYRGDDLDTGDVWDISLENINTSSAALVREGIDNILQFHPRLKYDDGSYLELSRTDPAFRVYGLNEFYNLVKTSNASLPDGFAFDLLFKYYPHLAFDNRHGQLAQQSTRYSSVVMAKARIDNALSNIFNLGNPADGSVYSWCSRMNKSDTSGSAAMLQKAKMPQRTFFNQHAAESAADKWTYDVVNSDGNMTLRLVNWHVESDARHDLMTPAFLGTRSEIDGSSAFTDADKRTAYTQITGSGNLNNATYYSMQVEDVIHSITVSFTVNNASLLSGRAARVGVGIQCWSDVKTSGTTKFLNFTGYKELQSNYIPSGTTTTVTFTFVIPEGTKYIIPVFKSYDYNTSLYVSNIKTTRTAVVQYKTRTAESSGLVVDSNRVRVRRKDNRGNWLTVTHGSKTYDAVYGYALATTPSSNETYLVKDTEGNYVLAEGTGKLDAFLDDTFMIQMEDGTFLTLDDPTQHPEYADFNKGVATEYFIRTSNLTWDHMVNRPNRAFIGVRKRVRITTMSSLSVRKIVPIPCWHDGVDEQYYSFTYLVYKSDYKAPIILGSAQNANGYVLTKNFPVFGGASDDDVNADHFACNDPNKIYGLYPVADGNNAVELEYIPGLNSDSTGQDVKHLVFAFNAINSADYAEKWLYAEPDGYDAGEIADGQITTTNIDNAAIHVFGRSGSAFRRPYLECVPHIENGKTRYRYQVPYNASDTNYGFPDTTTSSAAPHNWFMEMFYDMAVFPSDMTWASNTIAGGSDKPTHFRVRHPTISGYASDPMEISNDGNLMNYLNPIYCDTVRVGANGEIESYDFHLPIPDTRCMAVAVVEFMRKNPRTDDFEYLLGVPVEVVLKDTEH